MSTSHPVHQKSTFMLIMKALPGQRVNTNAQETMLSKHRKYIMHYHPPWNARMYLPLCITFTYRTIRLCGYTTVIALLFAVFSLQSVTSLNLQISSTFQSDILPPPHPKVFNFKLTASNPSGTLQQTGRITLLSVFYILLSFVSMQKISSLSDRFFLIR